MIAAVKVESHALFSVKEKLQEMDTLRDQLVAVNKRMVEQEQTNLNLKQALIQDQKTISELRKQKADVKYCSISLKPI
jgi:predicted  nucleic acid-binding Zn-ribbon protein